VVLLYSSARQVLFRRLLMGNGGVTKRMVRDLAIKARWLYTPSRMRLNQYGNEQDAIEIAVGSCLVWRNRNLDFCYRVAQ